MTAGVIARGNEVLARFWGEGFGVRAHLAISEFLSQPFYAATEGSGGLLDTADGRCDPAVQVTTPPCEA